MINLVLFCTGLAQPSYDLIKNGLASIETDYTISKVRSANNSNGSYILASSYEGTLMGISLDGDIFWENKLSGFMNHDIWAGDLDRDGNDELLAANADGTLYCLNNSGELRWKFRKNNAPLYSVCTIIKGEEIFAVVGGFDKSVYYLSADGELVMELKSSTYSNEKARVNKLASHSVPDGQEHLANFLRPMSMEDGSQRLILHGINNSMAARGSIYVFEPLDETPLFTETIKQGKPYGHMSIGDLDGNGEQDVILGPSAMLNKSILTVYNSKSQVAFPFRKLKSKKLENFGYRVAQSEVVIQDDSPILFTLIGNNIVLFDLKEDLKPVEILGTRYSFNDMWKIENENKIILASAQSGGSAIHVLDLDNENWKKSYENLTPPGKIQSILDNTEVVKKDLKKFKRPNDTREPVPVYLMAEALKTPKLKAIANELSSNYSSPIFLNGAGGNKAENFDRSHFTNEKYKIKRDGRRTYSMTQKEALDGIIPRFEGSPGIAYWGGHGNDPFMFQPSTTMKVLDAAKGKKTVLIYPELEDHSDDFQFVLDNMMFPIARHAQKNNGIMYLRNKHTFWLGSVYRSAWKGLLSGEFSDVFVPSMEETTDKSMELSLSGRLGLWASGAVDSWGTRCARDNASFDRLRQHGHQELPNHFLRNMVYHASYGAQYMHNFSVDQEYMSLLWELIAKEALYVPKREEVLSFSPVHLSMKEPDEYYMEESTNAKWLTFYDEQKDKENPRVFSHLGGSWPGAPVTEWDFSKYAAGQNERRLNFLSTYNNGLVMITPPQEGVFADTDAPRGKLVDHLHPIYKNIMKEYITDGRDYHSADGKEIYAPDEYYKVIEKDIKEKSLLLPIIVKGDVAWVAAQTGKKNIRLTVIDNGYINPNDREATIHFNSVYPVKLTNILTGEEIQVSNGKAQVTVPLGMFVFFDVELDKSLK